MRNTILTIAILSMTIGCKKEESATHIPEKKTPIEQLISGNQRFIEEKSIHPHQDKKTVLKKPK
jgi:carbonic anhydrase